MNLHVMNVLQVRKNNSREESGFKVIVDAGFDYAFIVALFAIHGETVHWRLDQPSRPPRRDGGLSRSDGGGPEATTAVIGGALVTASALYVLSSAGEGGSGGGCGCGGGGGGGGGGGCGGGGGGGCGGGGGGC